MYDVSESFADLRGDKMQQAHEASLERKCGTCRFFVVRPPEVEIAVDCPADGHVPARVALLRWAHSGDVHEVA